MASSIANSRRGRSLAASLALALAMSIGGVASAQDVRDPKLAQSLFDRARALMDQGKFTEACPLFEESHRLDPGGGTLLNFAVCLEQAGKLATAHATFHEALSLAIREGRDDRKKLAEERVAALAPKLSTITVDVPAEARVPGIVVWLDGAKLSPIAGGVPTAVDGGEHRVETTAPDAKPWFAVVDVSPEGHKVTVRVEPPESMFDDGTPDPDAAPAPAKPKKAKKPKKKKPATKLSTATWITGGVGLGVLVAGTGMGIAAVVKDDQLETEALENGCNVSRGYCPDGAAEDYAARAEDVQALGWAATASLGVGAALMLIAPLLPRERVVVTPSATVTADGGYVGVSVRLD